LSNNKIARLQQLLLRAGTVVEEAEGRRVTNRGMLLQLRKLREAMYRGYYMLDTSVTRASRPRRGVAVSKYKLQSDMDNLEATLDGMKEFLLILMHFPPIVRQPYSSYLIMERCMFGRHVEKEQILNFLLHHPCSYLDVLPVIGPCYVGKRTLVEHVCREEVVQINFSHILRFSSDDLNNLANDSESYTRRKLLGPSDGRSLIVVELVHDTDVVAWGKLYHSLRHGADGSKVILISRMDRVSSLGTVQALRLTRLHREEYWYYFRVLAFGSANPYDHHPDLASIAKEIATEIDGSFMIASTITNVLRANMTTKCWLRALGSIRRSIQMHILVFGEDPRDTQSRKRYLSYFHSFSHDGPPIFCYNRYTTRSLMQGDMASMIRPEDMLNARAVKYEEKFDAIFQSHIPPYYYYIINCVVEKPKRVDLGDKCLKRKRNSQILSMTL
ncbi:uncharacterized protein LOC133930986, partial [Phragmites australis]|uniref:uncharacterized protein LOC133930986 n=1 Tax=Phragmites australis TaxID=29695 RepID=UPI002D772354